MQITVHALSQEELVKPNTNPNNQSQRIREQVIKTRAIQMARQKCINAHLSSKTCEAVCELGEAERAFLSQAMTQLKFSARGYHRLLKVSRTIADIHESPKVTLQHLQHALSFKQTLQMPR
jgi:magnesium chelatase family protein